MYQNIKILKKKKKLQNLNEINKNFLHKFC